MKLAGTTAPTSIKPSVGIVGAGLSGLTLAYALQQQNVPYQLFDAAKTPGGYMASERVTLPDGQTYLRELGPNSLLGDDALLGWLRELGLTDKIQFAKPVSKARFVFRNGAYQELPATPPALLFGRFFSGKTKIAVLREWFNKTKSVPGETLGQFFRRRFTDELVDYALAPFVAGIYAGDPDRLLVSETFPVLLDYENQYGSVLRGLIKNQSKTARRQSFSFQDGMQTLPRTLANKLTNLSLGNPVQRIERTRNGQWCLSTLQGVRMFDRLVMAIPADAAARLLAQPYPEIAKAIRQIDYPPMTVVHSAYKRADVKHPLNGFGGLNPQVEHRFCAGHIWSSSLFDGRCPADEVLFTTFVGGQTNADNARQPDAVLFDRVHRELAASFGISTNEPTWRGVYRWEHAIPQYDATLAAVKPLITNLEKENLFICANWQGGVSLADCIKKGRELAGRL
jgi:protoporphyrinogen/coproporphyrinogen III oxidase